MSIFSTKKAIIVAGAKHGSTQLHHIAHQTLGIPITDKDPKRGETMTYVKTFRYKELYRLVDQEIRGKELLESLNFPTTNTVFNKINFAYDLSNYKGKPLMLIVRDPLKAANAAIIEDLLRFLNIYSGVLASTIPEVAELFKKFKSSKINKIHLGSFKKVETLMFKLNEQALEFQYKLGIDEQLFPHTDYHHLTYISNILDFLTITRKKSILDNTFIVDLDVNIEVETKRALHQDQVLINNTPNSIAHTTVPLLSKLPSFLNKIANNNNIYNKRLRMESAVYEYIQTQYVDNLFLLSKYNTCQNLYARNCFHPFGINKVNPII